MSVLLCVAGMWCCVSGRLGGVTVVTLVVELIISFLRRCGWDYVAAMWSRVYVAEIWCLGCGMWLRLDRNVPLRFWGCGWEDEWQEKSVYRKVKKVVTHCSKFGGSVGYRKANLCKAAKDVAL